MSVPHSPLTHISNTDSRLLLSNVVDSACKFCPPTTLQVLPHVSMVNPAIPKLTFSCSSLRAVPVEELQISVDDGEAFGAGEYNRDSAHNAETRERIRQRTLEALRNPKVRKKMAEHPRSHRRVWQEKLKSKRSGEQFFLSWKQNIANAAKKGGCGQEELDWDSYDKIKEQMELHQHLQAEEKEKEKLMAIAGAKKFIQSWWECIAKVAKKGGSGEQELDWDSYEQIQQEMFLLYQFQRTTEKAKAKEMAREKAEKAARIKAIKRVHICNNISSEVARGGVLNSIFPTYNKLDLELIKREKMQKEVSLADQIQAARLKKGKLH
ncbi:hypothetical protein SESBI_29257 [Sesbania bispinosa]|nr:hypothetical protein SESBI_29257 [Sesbania bispinosa]